MIILRRRDARSAIEDRMLTSDLFAQGFAVADIRLTDEQCDHLAAAIPSLSASHGVVRGLIQHPAVVQLLLHKQFGGYLWSVVGRDLVAVKATLFDKMVALNWRAQWHQDRVIAIRERMQISGYGSWSMKAGVQHAEPPAAVLQQMLAVRIYLDHSDTENGPLRVIPGSHVFGKLSDEDLQNRVADSRSIEVHVAKGGLLLMHPLLIHSTSESHTTEHRRVLHVELAPAEAISPLQWHTMLHLQRAA
ncbi:MAG TPA: phytanoyl-CoA dioxygenase family protein [Thermoanaerobaculia bacterium]